MESFKNKGVGFSFNVRKKEEASIHEVKQEVNTNIQDIKGNVDKSLIKIKTEPDCDIAPATVHFMHQEEKPVKTMLTSIKEEIDSDTNVSNNNDVTIHLLIPETISDVNTEVDVQTNEEEKIFTDHSLVDSDMSLTLSQLTDTREDSVHVSSDTIPEIISVQSVPIGLTKRQRKKPKNYSEFYDQESLAPPSSKAEKKHAKKRKTGSANAKTNVAVPEDNIGHESPTPHSSTDLSEIVLGSDQSNKREKKGSKNKKKKETVVCPFCDRKMCKQYFPYHARVHTDERPFKCPKCSYESRFKGPLEFHMESHHPTEGYIKMNS